MSESHAKCVENGSHLCQELSGRTCVEPACDADAGTWWGPLWCPEHDKERLDRIGDSFDQILASAKREVPR